MRAINIIVCFFLLWAANIAFALPPNSTYKIDNLFLKYANHYFDSFYFPTHPTLAVQLGIHFYDNELEDFSKAAVVRNIADLRDFERNLVSFDPAPLSDYIKGDRALILNNVRSEILTLETIRPWEKNPDYYSSGITNAAFVLMERNFAPADQRLRSLIAREKLMPSVLQEARKNLKNPPRIYTEVALEQLPGIINFFKTDLPKAFESVKQKSLQHDFSVANSNVIKALNDYQAWLQKEVLPHSHGNYRLGAKTFSEKLYYDEMVNVPLPRLLKIGMANLRKDQRELIRLAKEIDPNKSPQQVLAALKATHPAPKDLLNAFKNSMDDIIKFLSNKKIITVPQGAKPIVEETPPFMRATTFASMDTPGPFEESGLAAFYNVTLPNPAWNKAEVDDFMRSYTRSTIVSTSIHEAYPGHYVQFLWMNRINDRVRKILGANTNIEGWAHYTEQMLYDEGYRKGKPDAKLMRLGQLLDALLRDARYIVSIKMHTGQMSFDQAVDFFVREGYQTRMLGSIEAKRATSDPTYLYYTLGKLQILKLRKDLEAKTGKAFNLRKFHDDFMRQGAAPIKIIRASLLHDNSDTL